jgi:hypothetical protein
MQSDRAVSLMEWEPRQTPSTRLTEGRPRLQSPWAGASGSSSSVRIPSWDAASHAPCDVLTAGMRSTNKSSPGHMTCQLDTNIHLWRITAHNAVHRCEVAEMLKAPPHDFRAGAVAPTAPHKPAELGDPGDGLA